MAPPTLVASLAVLLAVPLFAGCIGEPDADVLATFYPLAFVAQRIAGDDVTVALLVPEGTEPHDWAPSARDYQRIDRASLVVAQGLGFEPWLDDAIDSLGSKAPPVVHSAEGLDEGHEPWQGHEHGDDHDNETTPAGNMTLVGCVTSSDMGPGLAGTCVAVGKAAAQPDDHDDHGHDGGDVDPHTWLDPVLFAQQVEQVRDALMAAFPDHADAFGTRADALLHDLEDLHETYGSGLDECAHDFIVVPHDAFSHLAGRYGFHVEAVSGLDPEAEPAASRVQEIIDLVRTEGVPIVFSESGGDARIMRSIAQEADVNLRVIHTLEGRPTDARAAGHDYLDLMRDNLAGLQAAMECTA